jgi:hypothetical protein
MNVINPTPFWKRKFSLKYRRCCHQWEKVRDYIDEGEQWYEVYCAKCDSPMFFSKRGIDKLTRISEIRREYGVAKADRHFFMFETEEEVVEEEEAPWHRHFRESIVKARLATEQARLDAERKGFLDEIIQQRIEAEKHRRHIESMRVNEVVKERLKDSRDALEKVELQRLRQQLTIHHSGNGRGDADDKWHFCDIQQCWYRI